MDRLPLTMTPESLIWAQHLIDRQTDHCCNTIQQGESIMDYSGLFKSIMKFVSFVIIGLIGYFIWTTFLSARFSALGACDKGAGCLFTAVNGNRTISVIGFSADNSRFLTDGTSDGIIHDAANGRKVATLDEGTENHSYVLSSDRTEILAYRTDSIMFFDWEGELLRTWAPDEDDSVGRVATLPLVNGFVTSGKKGISLWHMTDGSLITQLSDLTSVLYLVASTDGEFVAAYNFVDDEIHVWPLQDLSHTLVLGEIEANSIHLNADGSLLAAGGPDGAFVWHTSDGSLVASLEPEGVKATATGFSEDGSLLAVGFENGMLVVVDVATEQIIKTFEHEYSPDNIIFLPDNSGVAVGLNFDVQVSGGELIFDRDPGEQFSPGANIRTDENRISVRPGYAVVWSLAD